MRLFQIMCKLSTRLAIGALLCFTVSLHAQLIGVTFSMTNFTGTTMTRKITVTPDAQTLLQTDGSTIITGGPLTLSAASITTTNLWCGLYHVTLDGIAKSWLINVTTNFGSGPVPSPWFSTNLQYSGTNGLPLIISGGVVAPGNNVTVVTNGSVYTVSSSGGSGSSNMHDVGTTNITFPGSAIGGDGRALTNIPATAIIYGPSITSFGNNQQVVETGATVNSTVLTWTLSGSAPTSQSINLGVGSVAPGTLTATDSASYTTTRNYVLTVGNAIGNATANSIVAFEDRNYDGVSSLSSLNDAQIIALASTPFGTSRVMRDTLDPSAQYIYFCYPAAYGAATFTVGGLPNTAWTLVTRAFVNASGYSESYNIYRSNNLLTGEYTVQTQ